MMWELLIFLLYIFYCIFIIYIYIFNIQSFYTLREIYFMEFEFLKWARAVCNCFCLFFVVVGINYHLLRSHKLTEID